VTPDEYGGDDGLWSRLWEIADNYLDVDAMVRIARTAEPIRIDRSAERPVEVRGPANKAKIGYFRDSVFTFYYPENLEALENEGAELVPVSSLEDTCLPEVDALYIGGGFPETHADRLAGNRAMMESVKDAAAGGLPIYAECGGLIYLCRSLECNERVYPMSGVFPVDLGMRAKPIGHGYVSVRVESSNPYYEPGTRIKGHEFHYTGTVMGLGDAESCMAVETGVGLGDSRDGLVWNNTLACYTHVHANGVKEWAPSMISAAAEFAANRRRGRSNGGGIKSIAF
jgi:cobyrinic acid a,c-diamide synthase